MHLVLKEEMITGRPEAGWSCKIFQPYFYYPLVLSLALFIAVNVAVRSTKVRDHRLRSYLFALPLLSPLIVYALYPPLLEIKVMEIRFLPSFSLPANPMPFIHMHAGPPPVQDLLSVTGTACMAGLVLECSCWRYVWRSIGSAPNAVSSRSPRKTIPRRSASWPNDASISM